MPKVVKIPPEFYEANPPEPYSEVIGNYSPEAKATDQALIDKIKGVSREPTVKGKGKKD